MTGQSDKSGVNNNEAFQFSDLGVGDRLSIAGELFTVQKLVGNTASLVPKSENGDAQLVYYEDSNSCVFVRHKGLDQNQIKVVQ